jgi:ornithine carbamoyltransferase
MMNLRNRSFLAVDDFSASEIHYLLSLAAELKQAKAAGTEQPRLKGKNIALIFEKDSTRTRIGFEVAAYDQGAHVTYLGPTGTQIGHKESMKDTARVLGRIYDGIEYRGFAQSTVEELAKYSGVPVFNGLTDAFHPTQILADLLTMQEHAQRPLEKLSFCFLGDVRNNVAESLMIGGSLMGMDVRLCGPRSRWPDPELVKSAEKRANASGGQVNLSENLAAAVKACDFVYTDVWVSMGEPENLWAERIATLRPYQVNRKLLELADNPRVKFMHCLPAVHNADTKLGRKVRDAYGLSGMEVTDDVFESEQSVVFDQAENRMHTIKALLVATMGS